MGFPFNPDDDAPVAIVNNGGGWSTLLTNGPPYDNTTLFQGYGVAYAPDLRTWVIVGAPNDSNGISYAVAPSPTQYQRIYGWTVIISDDALETVSPVLTSPEDGIS